MEAPTSQSHVGSRNYKSRRNRPCDLCRARKQACVIKTTPPCELCRVKGRPCTFLNGPGPRRRPNRTAVQDAADGGGGRSSRRAGQGHVDDLVAAELSPGKIFDMTNFHFDFRSPEDRETPDASPSARAPATDAGPSFGISHLPHVDQGAMEFHQSRSLQGQSLMDTMNVITQPGLGENDQILVPTSQVHSVQADVSDNFVTLEHQAGRSYRFVGPCGELDTYLISRRRCNDQLQSESSYTAIQYQFTRHFEPSDVAYQPPDVFTLGETSRLENAEPKLELGSLDQLRSRFASLVGDRLARDLIRLYFQYVSPSFPILRREQIPAEGDILESRLPLSLLAAICASSLPFIIYDDALFVEEADAPPEAEMYQIAWTALQMESQDIRLTTIQASLLILQRQAREDLFGEASFNLRLCGMIASSCNALGLNRDPTSWTVLVPWERRLRKLLWWAAFVSDTWTTFGQGMPGHIHLDESDTPLLTRDDLEDSSVESDSTCGGGGGSSSRNAGAAQQFYHLVTLSLILWDIKAAFFSIRAMKLTSGDLQLALNTAKPLRARLIHWHQDLPPALRLTQSADLSRESSTRATGSDGLLNGSGALRLAYVVAQISLFRAILRPLAMASITAAKLSERPSFWENDAAIAMIQGAVGLAKELVRFINTLTAADWDSFWHSWSKHNFAIASTFLMHLLILTQPSQTGYLAGFSPQQESPSQNGPLPYAHSPSSSGSPSADVHYIFAGEYAELQALARQWRRALRLAERGAGGRKGLLNATLRRTEALFRELQMAAPKRSGA